jgi:tetratricopeptide (TPR) repeat protein
MIDYQQANSLAKSALKLWGAGRLEEAADGYSRAIALLGGEQPGCEYFHSALAGVLTDLGRHGEATVHYEKALAAELARASSEVDVGVKMARHALAVHLTGQDQAGRAFEILAPALDAFPNDWLLGAAHAQLLLALGRRAEARAAAQLAIANASSDTKKQELTEHLKMVLAERNG